MNARSTNPNRILIADDDPLFCTVAVSTLSKAGFEVAIAENGAEAMEKLIRHRFDLAIVDLVMPRIDGIRLIALIRATPGLRDLPIMIITSQKDPSLQREGLLVGANAFLSKPVDWKNLPAMVNELIHM